MSAEFHIKGFLIGSAISAPCYQSRVHVAQSAEISFIGQLKRQSEMRAELKNQFGSHDEPQQRIIKEQIEQAMFNSVQELVDSYWTGSAAR
jgi:hypothetical protein